MTTIRHLLYVLLGVIFGFALVKGEAVSWYRIQEMFHFHSFHMYGVLMTAIATGVLGVQLLKRWGPRKALSGTDLQIPVKPAGRTRYVIGSLVFGLGWGLIGMCPGPMFALSLTGGPGVLVALAGALHGTWLYGALREHLPHD